MGPRKEKREQTKTRWCIDREREVSGQISRAEDLGKVGAREKEGFANLIEANTDM